jgi:hypothetical protein
MPPPRANAAVAERLTQSTTQTTESFFMPRHSSHTVITHEAE